VGVGEGVRYGKINQVRLAASVGAEFSRPSDSRRRGATRGQRRLRVAGRTVGTGRVRAGWPSGRRRRRRNEGGSDPRQKCHLDGSANRRPARR